MWFRISNLSFSLRICILSDTLKKNKVCVSGCVGEKKKKKYTHELWTDVSIRVVLFV